MWWKVEDVHHVASFDKSEWDFVRAMASKPHLDNFIRLLDRKLDGQSAYDDHHRRRVEPIQQARVEGLWARLREQARSKLGPTLNLRSKLPEIGPSSWSKVRPLQVRKKEDIYTNNGMTRQSQLCTGESSTGWTHMGAGTGNTTPEGTGNTALDAEVGSRVALTAGQHRFASGTSEKYAGSFPANFPTADIVEFALFDASSSGVMGLRVVFAPAISHVSGSDIFVCTSAVTKTASSS